MYWTVHLEGGPKRVNHAAVAVGNIIYSFGGYCSSENYSSSSPIDIFSLNTESYRWSAISYKSNELLDEVPFKRFGHVVVMYDNKCYLWGGRNNIASCDILYCFDPAKRVWTKPSVSGNCPLGRDGHSGSVINNSFYIFGGYIDAISQYGQDVHCLDFKSMIWTLLIISGRPPICRDFHTASAIGDRMYVFGGRSDHAGPYYSQNEVYSREISYLDTSTKTWHNVSSFISPLGRRSHSAFVYKNNLYITGGFNGSLKKFYDSILCFKPATNTWHSVEAEGTQMSARRRHCTVLVGSKLFVFGGTSPNLQGLEKNVTEMNQQENLLDHSDLYVLDLNPSLKSLCIQAVLKYNLPYDDLPKQMIFEFDMMLKNNTISSSTTTSS